MAERKLESKTGVEMEKLLRSTLPADWGWSVKAGGRIHLVDGYGKSRFESEYVGEVEAFARGFAQGGK